MNFKVNLAAALLTLVTLAGCTDVGPSPALVAPPLNPNRPVYGAPNNTSPDGQAHLGPVTSPSSG